MLEKKFYRQLEEKAKKLETTPDKLIYNAKLIEKLKNETETTPIEGIKWLKKRI